MSTDNGPTFIGNIVDDLELRYTNSGVAVCQFRIAINKRVYDKQQNKYVDGDATFLRVNAWRHLGEHVMETMAKGQRVIVVGPLEQRNYETREGEKRTSYEIVAEDIGPSLKFAVGQMRRANDSTSSDGTPRSQGGGQNFGGHAASGPAGGGQPSEDPWNSTPGAGGFSGGDEPPF